MVYPRVDSDLRVKQTVRRHRVLSREGLLEQLFERPYRGMVYTQIREDPEVDLEALALRSGVVARLVSAWSAAGAPAVHVTPRDALEVELTVLGLRAGAPTVFERPFRGYFRYAICRPVAG